MTAAQIAADLRGEFGGRLAFDPAVRAVYAGDAGPFAVAPLGVACPRNVEELRRLVRYARSAGLPLVPRGAGTGTAGGCVGPGLVVDLSAHLRRIVSLDAGTVTAEAGVTLGELDATLAAAGRRLACGHLPRPAGTVGGLVAADGAGPALAARGTVRDHVAGLGVVWDDGSNAELGFRNAEWKTAERSRRSATDSDNPHSETRVPHSPRLVELRAQTAALLAGHRELIQLARPLARFAGGGYRLGGVLTPAGLDLARLLCGSGGTLGIVTSVTLRTAPLPGGECRAAVGFPSVDAAVRAGLALSRTDGLTECELLDGRLAAAARGAGVVGVPASVGAVLVLAWEEETEAMAWACGHAALDGLRGRHVSRRLADPATDPAGLERVRAFRAAAVGNLYAVGPGRRPVPGCDDVAVPLDELARFLADARTLVQRAGLTASLDAHVAAGVVHLRPLLDLSDPADAARFWPLADALHARALACGGSIGPTLGTGLARTPWVAAQVGPLAPVFAELKRVFDPAGVLNPGQVVGPDPSRPAWPLREGARGEGQGARGEPEPTPHAAGRTVLAPRPSPLAPSCNSCGDCRPRVGPGRMCPTFRAGGDETATPRAKAELVRAGADPTGEEARAVAGLCVHCKMCPRECRAGVDVPGMAVRLKAAYHAAHGLPRGAWLPARIDGLSRFAGVFAMSANVALDSAPARWLLEKTVGLARRRRLPRLTHRTFLRRAWAGGLCGEPRPLPGAARVAYFVDTFANRHDPLVGLAAVAVLRRNGFAVRVPWRQKASGLAPLVAGDRDAARELAAYNVRTLAPLVRDGYAVVCTEPAAAVALGQEYPALLGTPDAELVAANTVEFTALLGKRLAAGALDTGFREVPLSVGLHVPCHVKALGEPAAARLLGRIPGLTLVPLADSCSGMAGPWGLTAANTPTSLAAGKVMLDSFADPAVRVGTAECSSCRLQMQDAAGKRVVHPALLLAHAYGLLPQIGRRLARPVGKRLTDG